MGVDLKGVVSFHGSLATQAPAKPGEVKARILVCNGAADPFITKEVIEQFKKEMRDAKAEFLFKKYSGALHSFTNPDGDSLGKKFNLPLAYNKKADRQSWNDMKAFFENCFSAK